MSLRTWGGIGILVFLDPHLRKRFTGSYTEFEVSLFGDR